MQDLKNYFKSNGIQMKWFAKKHKLDYVTLNLVVNGHLNGEKSNKKNNYAGNTRKIYTTLYKLGIIDDLPEGIKEKKVG